MVVIGGYIWMIRPKEISSIFSTNLAKNQSQNEIELYITSNGFHTDIVIPIERSNNFFISLAKDSTLRLFLEKSNAYKWLGVGWGDKGFYNESYHGNFPSFSACLNAALLPSETLMHIDFYKYDLKEGKNCKKIKLKQEEYQKLLQHIQESFRTVREETENQTLTDIEFIRLPQKGYSESDFFFEAKGNYHLFYTCNSWTNEALQKANQKTACFAPLAHTILYHLE